MRNIVCLEDLVPEPASPCQAPGLQRMVGRLMQPGPIFDLHIPYPEIHPQAPFKLGIL